VKNWDSSVKKKPFAFADRYHVETLMGICRPSSSHNDASGSIDVEELRR